jgi:hypothetical protein
MGYLGVSSCLFKVYLCYLRAPYGLNKLRKGYLWYLKYLGLFKVYMCES